jgi:hypothetical protein
MDIPTITMLSQLAFAGIVFPAMVAIFDITLDQE